MRSKRMRVLMPATTGRDYITTANVNSRPGGSVELSNISGMPSSVTIETTPDRILGRKRSGRRGQRTKTGDKS